MKRKLLTLFALALMMLGVQSANALTLTCLRGSGFGEGEGCQKLFDGDQETKWGTWDGWYDNPVYAVVKAAMPIIPQGAYSLRIANDTNTEPGRNWKSWRILGGNFASDDDAVYGAEDWVTLDQKVDQELTTEQFAEVQLEMSNPDGNAYSYFMIIVDAIVDDGFGAYTQMADFWFRSFTIDTSKAQQYLDFDYETGTDADLKAAYAEKKTILENALKTNNSDQIIPAVDDIVSIYNKIVNLRNGVYIALDWTDSWGDGVGSNFVDKNDYSKWGGNFPDEGEHVQYIIFRTQAQQPFFYKLVTGGDTERFSPRNWRTWKVFGGNFASEAEAGRDADGWVVIDERNETDILPAKNNYPTLLKFTNGVSAAYSFYKVEITASGSAQQQMSEIYLCSEEEFNAIRQSRIDELAEFAAGLDALTVERWAEADKEAFATKYNELKTTTDADVLTSLYSELVALKQTIEASVVLWTVSLKAGIDDADKWTAKAGYTTSFGPLPLDDVPAGTTVTLADAFTDGAEVSVKANTSNGHWFGVTGTYNAALGTYTTTGSGIFAPNSVSMAKNGSNLEVTLTTNYNTYTVTFNTADNTYTESATYSGSAFGMTTLQSITINGLNITNTLTK